jgi:hypothetical protein
MQSLESGGRNVRIPTADGKIFLYQLCLPNLPMTEEWSTPLLEFVALLSWWELLLYCVKAEVMPSDIMR